MEAMISATTLTHIGIWYVPTVTCACLTRRTTWPMAKSAKITLATRNPEACELIGRCILTAGFGFANPECVWTTQNANKMSCGCRGEPIKSRRPNRLRRHCGHASVVLSRLTGLSKTTCYGTAPGHRKSHWKEKSQRPKGRGSASRETINPY